MQFNRELHGRAQGLLCAQRFSYLNAVWARGLLNLGNLDHQNWENLMQSKRTGPSFRMDLKAYILAVLSIGCFNFPS